MKSEKGMEFVPHPLEIYMEEDRARQFAEKEKNDANEHGVISKILDSMVAESFGDKKNVKIANLGAGANPQKYEIITNNQSVQIDWVDVSGPMLEIASQEASSLKASIEFIKKNFFEYLEGQNDGSLDCVMMQYAINYIDDLELFFKITSKKLKDDGSFFANLGIEELENNPNCKFLVNGEEFTGRRKLVEGDKYTIQFFGPNSNLLGSTEKNFFSKERIIRAVEMAAMVPRIEKTNGFEVLIAKK